MEEKQKQRAPGRDQRSEGATLVQSFTTIAELARVPEDKLLGCLHALRGAIVQAKRQHAAGVREGLIRPDAELAFETFTWRPKGATAALPSAFTGETPIDELPIRYRARQFLRERHIFCLEDLSQMTEAELIRGDNIGAKTVGRLRELLQRIGQDFLPNNDPEDKPFLESRLVREMDDERLAERLQGLSDDAPVSALGLRPTTLKRALRRGYTTLGRLRQATPRDFAIHFGKAEGREIYARMKGTGLAFQVAPADTVLWRHGLVELKDLVAPRAPETPIADLRPWLGMAYPAIANHPVRTLGELRAIANAGGLTGISGVADAMAERLRAFLRSLAAGIEPVPVGARPARGASNPPAPASAAWPRNLRTELPAPPP